MVSKHHSGWVALTSQLRSPKAVHVLSWLYAWDHPAGRWTFTPGWITLDFTCLLREAAWRCACIPTRSDRISGAQLERLTASCKNDGGHCAFVMCYVYPTSVPQHNPVSELQTALFPPSSPWFSLYTGVCHGLWNTDSGTTRADWQLNINCPMVESEVTEILFRHASLEIWSQVFSSTFSTSQVNSWCLCCFYQIT